MEVATTNWRGILLGPPPILKVSSKFFYLYITFKKMLLVMIYYQNKMSHKHLTSIGGTDEVC